MFKVKEDSEPPTKSAHVIVCGNEKGGSGKTTTAMHLAVALLRSGFNVATVDLDSRQLSLTRYIENRRRWAQKQQIDLPIMTHFHVPAAGHDSVAANENAEYEALAEGLAEVESQHDFVVIDTPGSNTYLNRLAHMLADTLVTPMNDSFVDLDVLARVNPETFEIEDMSQYALSVRDARRERRATEQGILDWVVVRNRVAQINSRNEQRVQDTLRRLSHTLGFRLSDGIGERVIFREFFPIGLTALDEFDEHVLGTKPTLSHLSARQETRQLMAALRLPIDENGRKRVERRKVFMDTLSKPLNLPDIFAV